MDTNSGDWRDEKSLAACLLHMLESEDMCNVTFILGVDKTRISAHKTVLASRSAVFHTMFNGSLPEKGEVVVPDIDAKTFREILSFMYSDEISITENNMKELVYASEKYMLTRIKKACETELKKIATTEHATKALESAFQYQMTDLQKVSIDYIEQHAADCLSSEHALALSKDCVKIILQNDFLDCTETEVCKFFFDWMRTQCASKSLEPSGSNLRETAGDLLYLIRFPVVDMKYFSTEIRPTGVLLPDEVIDIYQSHIENKVKSSDRFSTFPRGPLRQRKEYSVQRNGSIGNLNTYQGDHALSFQSNHNIWLKSITCFTPYSYEEINYDSSEEEEVDSYQIQLVILDDIGEEQTSISVTSYTDCKESKVCFKEPVFLKAGKNYTAIWKLPAIYFPNRFVMKQLLNCENIYEEPTTGVSFTFKHSPKSTTGTNEKQGVFKSFSFSV